MPHAIFTKRIFAILSLMLVLAACSDGGSTTTSSQVGGRNLELPDSNKQAEPEPGEITSLELFFESPITGTVTYQSFNITAAEKSDYLPVSGSKNVVEGVTSSILVDIYGDDEIEGDEQFGIRILDEDGREIMVIIGQISNDDFPGLTVNTPTISEGDVGTSRLTFLLELTHPVVDPYTINVASQDCEGWVHPSGDERFATPCSDFEAVDATLVFQSGVQSMSFSVIVLSDNILELDETVVLDITSGDEVALTDGGQATGTIRTDETPTNNGFTLIATSSSVDEGKDSSEIEDTGDGDAWQLITYQVEVDLPENILQDQVIEYTLLGDEASAEGELFSRATFAADTSSDFCIEDPSSFILIDTLCTAVGSVLLEPGANTFDIEFYVSNDIVIEPNEVIELVLGNDQGVEFSRVFHTILNDDSPVLYIEVNGETSLLSEFIENKDKELSVNEGTGDDTSLTITLKLAAELADDWSVPFSFQRASGTGSRAGTLDFNFLSGALTFAKSPAEPRQQLVVEILADSLYEGDEFFELSFEGIGLAPLQIRIKDDDSPSIELVELNGSKIENSGSAVIFENIEILEFIDLDEPIGGQGSVAKHYKILLDDGETLAQSDLVLSYKVDVLTLDTLKNGANEYCSYLDSNNSQRSVNAGSDDYSIYINGVERMPLEEFIFAKNEAQLTVDLNVSNDSFVECEEFLSVTFYIVGGDAKDSRAFKISNQDKALLTVTGWSAEEGPKGEGSDHLESFNFLLDQAVNANIKYTLAGGGDDHACNAADTGVEVSGGSLQFELGSTAASIGVMVKGDDIVEPDEACTLSILSGDYSDLLNVQYCNEDEPCPNNLTAAQGVIQNDDKLDITITHLSNVTEPAESGDAVVQPISIKWEKEIAENVGVISFSLSKQNCDTGKDCIETSDITLADNYEYIIKSAGGPLVTVPADPIKLALSINHDDAVENPEQLKLSLTQEAGQEYIESVSQTNFDIQIASNDKLTITVSELLPGSQLDNNNESGYRTYQMTWGADKTVESTVPRLTFDLDATSDALRKTTSGQSDYEYLLKDISNADIYGNSMVFKDTDQALAGSGAVTFTLNLKDDDLVEVVEIITLALSKSNSNFINDFEVTKEHIIGIDDKLLVSLLPPDDYVNGEGESTEESESAFVYTIDWVGSVANNVPALTVDISHAGNAQLNSDFSVITPNNLTATTYTLKSEDQVLADGSAVLTLNIVDENIVEINETIDTLLQYSLNDFTSPQYVTLVNAVSDKIKLTHTILSNTDKAEFTLEQTAGSSESEEESEVTNRYKLSWNSTLGVNLGDIKLQLPFTGTATKGDANDDYSVSVTSGYADKLTLSGDTLTLKKAENLELTSLADNFVYFDVQINDDSFIEFEETLAAVLSSGNDTPSYVTFGANKSLNHKIVYNAASPDKAQITLSQVTGGTDSEEQRGNVNTYELAWVGDFGAGTGDIPLGLVFSGSATRGSDYTVSVHPDSMVPDVGSSHGKLTISGNTFTIKKDSDEILGTGNVKFNVTITNDNLVEIQEKYDAILATIESSPNYIGVSADQKISHNITVNGADKDKTTLSLEAVGGNVVSAAEGVTATQYTLSWTNPVADNVPALTVSLPLTGNASQADFSVTSPAGLTVSGTEYTFKPANGSLSENGSLTFTYTVINDNEVEITEEITARLTDPAPGTPEAPSILETYVTLSTTNHSLSHTITPDADTTELSLVADGTNVTSALENLRTATGYTLSWTNPVAADVPALTVKLPLTGNASLADFTVSPVADNLGNIITVSGTEYTFKPANGSLSENGSLTFTYTVINDNEVEITEEITARLTDPAPGTPEAPSILETYVTLSTTNHSLSHTITPDADTTELSLVADGTNVTSALENLRTATGYTLSWTNPVAADVPALTVKLPLTGNASLADFTVSPVADNLGNIITVSGTEYTFKPANGSLSENGSLTFTYTVINDNEVEITEEITARLTDPAPGTPEAPSILETYVTLSTTNHSLSHTITPDADTTELSLVADGTNVTSALENLRTATGYTLSWTNPVAADVPALTVKLPLTGNASLADFTVSPVADNLGNIITVSGTEYTFKPANGSLSENGSLTFTYTVINDNEVEITEEITARLTDPAPGTPEAPSILETYVTLSTTNHSLSHTITPDADTTELSLVADGTNVTSALENLRTATGYTLSWTNPVAADVPALTVKLPLTGNASLADFTVSPVADNLGNIITVSGTEYTFKPANGSLSENGSLTFTYTVINDNEVEITEEITARLTDPAPSTPEDPSILETYVTLSTTNHSLSHTITPDADKTVLSLTAVTGNVASANEELETTTSYKLAWTNAVAADVSALIVNMDFSASTATEGGTADYSLNILSAGLTRSGNAFTFKNGTTRLEEAGVLTFSIVVQDDEIVEIDEKFTATLQFIDTDGSEDGIQDPLMEYATFSGSNSVSHTIENTERTTLSLARASGEATSTEGDESTITFNLISNLAVASNVPNLEITLPISTGAGFATKDSDYTYTDLTLPIAGGIYTISTPLAAPATGETGTVVNTFAITVKDESTVELGEMFTATLGLNAGSDYAVLGTSSVSHKITNDDFIALSLTASPNFTEASSQHVAIMWTGAAEVEGIPDTIEYAVTVTNGTASTSDYAVETSLPDIAVVTGAIAENQVGDEAIVIIASDDIIENSETMSVALSFLGTPEEKAEYAQYVTLPSSQTYTITNDDFIAVTAKRFLTDDVTVLETAILATEEASTAPEYLAAQAALKEAQENLVTAQANLAAAQETSSDTTLESKAVAEAKTDVEEAQAAYDIENETVTDAITAEIAAASNLASSEISILQEASTYQVEVCIPADKSIPAGAANVVITASITTTGTDNEMLKLASCSDVALFNDAQVNTCTDISPGAGAQVVRNIIVNDLAAGQCRSITLITTDANDTQYQNPSFDIAYSSTDDSKRCELNCLEDQSITILNDDLINVVDTGLVECVQKSNGLFDLGCADTSDGYKYQDAAVTDFYPDLSYSYIDATGKPVQGKPATVATTCYQDNSTGLIWSQSSALVDFSTTPTISDCGLTELTWQTPSMQELMTIMELDPIGSIKPVSTDDGIGQNLLNLQSTGFNFWEDTSKYWTRDACLVGANPGQWTIDFITGHVECDLQTNKNYFISVYK